MNRCSLEGGDRLREPLLKAAWSGERLAAVQIARNGAARPPSLLESWAFAHYVDRQASKDFCKVTVIVILALVALFVGLRLYSVLGERTGHEQQPILRPADPDARVEPRPAQPATTATPAMDGGDMAFLPTAGPGVRAILAA